MSRPVPVDAKRSDWPRLVANAIAELQQPRAGEVRFMDGGLKYWDGAEWHPVP